MLLMTLADEIDMSTTEQQTDSTTSGTTVAATAGR